ncbi:MAG: glycoside hydrolase family 71/99-like protein [Verrucomicrobiales bacterium]
MPPISPRLSRSLAAVAAAAAAAPLALLPAPTWAAEIKGQVICGYQGWFRTPDDGGETGWHHYGGREFAPGRCGIEIWPDVSELPAAARVDTAFRKPGGSVAQVFSSLSPDAADLHFRWMKEYGIGGVFLQRFAVTAQDGRYRRGMDIVLQNVARSARDHGRCWGVMYDLSGLKPGRASVVIDDWKRIKAAAGAGDLAAHPNYLEHGGKPLVALWGAGFSDRDPMWQDWRALVKFFREDQKCAVLLGVPTYWREGVRDALPGGELRELIASADIVSPWTVGRYGDPEGARRHAEKAAAADLDWCRERGLAYLPVVFPGFSWSNLEHSRGREAKFDQIPRRGGRFLWAQCRANVAAGAEMLYVAMFDELDEATAIMKWDPDPPAGESRFLSEKGVPNDRYLRLAGQAGHLLRGQSVEERDGLPAAVLDSPK